MKIALGAVAGVVGGPATYAVELVRALAGEFPRDEITVLTDRPEAFSAHANTVHLPLGSSWEQPLWDHLRVPKALASGPFDLYHGTKGVLPRFGSLPSVVTIHDLASYVMPETFRLPQRLHLGFETPHAVRAARRVLTDSESSARDIRERFRGLEPLVEVIPLAAADGLRPASSKEVAAWRAARGMDGVTIGYLGTLQPRKNLDLLAEAFLLAAGDRPWRLALAGRLRPGYRPACLDWGDPRIEYLGSLGAEEIPPFFGSLTCMVSPSSYEGFGLSFIEAMACGCPVIGPDISSVPEVVGDAGLLVKRLEKNELAQAISTLAADDAAQAAYRERGLRRAAAFSWAETARRTRAVYEVALGG